MSSMILNSVCVFFVTRWPDLLWLHTEAMQLLALEGMVCYAAYVTHRKGANEVQVYINLKWLRTAVLKHLNDGVTISRI